MAATAMIFYAVPQHSLGPNFRFGTYVPNEQTIENPNHDSTRNFVLFGADATGR